MFLKKILGVFLGTAIIMTNIVSPVAFAFEVPFVIDPVLEQSEINVLWESETVIVDRQEARDEVDLAVAKVRERELILARSGIADDSFLTIDEVSQLTLKDFEYLYELMIEQNYDEISLVAEAKGIVEDGSNVYGAADINPYELALIALYPSHGITYVMVSQRSIDTSLNIYTNDSCWYSGNGDAFRHVLWNVLLYENFDNMALVYQDYWGASLTTRVATFTDAHERPAPYNVHREMDERNNVYGLYSLAPSLAGRPDVARQVELAIDRGSAVRVQKWSGVDMLTNTDNSEKR